MLNRDNCEVAARSRLAAAFACLIALSITRAALCGDQPLSGNRSPTVARVFAAWKTRQEYVKSFHFSWDCRIDLPKGYAFPEEPSLAALEAHRGEIVADNVQYTIPQSEFWGLGQDRFRDEFLMVSYAAPDSWKRTARIRNVIDGVTHSRLWVPLASAEAPLMTVWRQFNGPNNSDMELSGDSHWVARDIDLVPLLLTFRPVNAATGMVPERCRVISESARIGDVACVELRFDPIDDWQWQRFFQKSSPSPDRSDTCWVDPRRDYTIVRWERKRPWLKQIVSIAIDYERDLKHGWVPSHWRQDFPGARRTPKSGTFEATVTRYSINEALPEATFSRESPIRTRICDVSVNAAPPTDHEENSRKPASAHEPRLEVILAAWKQRQAKINTFKFTSRTEWTFKDSSSDRDVDLKNRPKYATLKCDDTVWVSGDRIALVTAVAEGPSPLPAFRRYEAAFDGRTSRTFFKTDLPGRADGFGAVKPGFDDQITEQLPVRPVLLAFRPLSPHLGRIVPSACRVLPSGGKISDISCVILETYNTQGFRECYWLDPARDYIVLRKHSMLNGQDYSRVDISYQHDRTFGWIPHGWNDCSVGDRGAWMHSHSVTVTGFRINEPIHASVFQVEFPKGAQVN